MAIADIVDTPKGTIFVLENGKTMVSRTLATPRKPEDIIEVLTGKGERFTIYRGGEIVREQGDFKEQVPYYDKYKYPDKPQSSEEAGYTPYSDADEYMATEQYAWEIKCKAVKILNAEEHRKQEKAFRLRLKALRHKWNVQEKALKNPSRAKDFFKILASKLTGRTRA